MRARFSNVPHPSGRDGAPEAFWPPGSLIRGHLGITLLRGPGGWAFPPKLEQDTRTFLSALLLSSQVGFWGFSLLQEHACQYSVGAFVGP